MPRIPARLRQVAISAATLVALCTAPALADVQVTLNGANLPLSPAPIERAGRIFVPLRGIFQGLGATVVYQGGQINATGGNRTVSLQIGSRTATVNGQQQNLDIPPFVIGASTYVPLRFVSQALGANVNYDGEHQIVAISSNGAAPVSYNAPPTSAPAAAPTAAAAVNSVNLAAVVPARNASVSLTRPAIRANFDQPVDVGTVHVYLDGRDVSNNAYLNPNQVDFTPPYDLPAEKHGVRITGKNQAGAPFDRSWAFTTTDAVAAPTANYINNLSPADGGQVGGTFRVRGTTLPNAKLHIVAKGAGATLGGIFKISDGDTYTTDVQADDAGKFDAEVSVNNPPGGSVIVALQSVSPNGQAFARRLQLQTK